MKQKQGIQVCVVVIGIVLVALVLSGCTSNDENNGSVLSGTWVGNMEMSMFGGGFNSTVTQITFSDNTMEMTSESDQGTMTMSYTYTLYGNTLVVEPSFPGAGGGFPGRQFNNGSRPWNGTRPPMNGTWNGTQPFNGTSPFNGTRPTNGSWNTGMGQPSMGVSFVYSFDEEQTILYLNGAPFTRIG